jgi:two-component system, OmpR family, alkaline phosphatase synthesis response regulator PhoP
MSFGQRDKPNILVVEDDDNVRRLVSAYLQQEGYDVRDAADGQAAIRMADSDLPDLVILDLMLPGIDGLEVAQRMRSRWDLPLLMLTSRTDERDVLDGFRAGADDYLTKPFSPKVLVARVKAILHRSGGDLDDEDPSLLVGDLKLDPRTREAFVAGRPVELTTTEFDLLQLLMEHPGWVYTREELLERVSGYTFVGDSRVIDVHIANLRRKLEDDPANPQHISTVRGVGYKFKTPA